ncbi:MAG: ribonuclease [Pseudomonadota bacterium]|jgi:ribonuclease HI
MQLKKVVIYTDGACSGNPGPGGWGAYMLYNQHEKKIYGYEENTTNNRMELMGAIKALQSLKTKCSIDIYTDSIYVQKGISEWIYNWIKNNRLTGDKKLVKNSDLWQTLYELSQKHEINWHWVKGHDGNAGNQIADDLACKGRDEAISINSDKQ